MGAIEQSARRERRIGAFQQAMLYAALGGVMVAIGAVPDFSKIIKYYAGAKKGARFNYRAKTVLGRLAAKGLLTFEERGGRRYARITERGRELLELEIQKVAHAKKRKWDRRWRVVIFDIPERRRSVRVRLRRFMEEYGFVRLQDSVWVYPHDCEDLIALAKANLRIGADALYMIVERIERDKHLREHFALPVE
ncbi:CRISPR-associated endonuclease Cas2 [Candidatus Kaiserbacteria bacterium]|nr:CRISPR-associated endonuclease Cas2 [Candidatus Kaiserbacteria bacterium]